MLSRCSLYLKMKFSIITPVYNGEKYITETIKSVLSQEGDFEIEYIIMDGASTDKTIELVQTYAKQVQTGQYPIRAKKVAFLYFSEKDHGMYDAIEKGFSRATGDICAYINADDKYLPGAFTTVKKIFGSFSGIEWVKGISMLCDEGGEILSEGSGYIYRQPWIVKGIYGRSAPFIHQEGVFWRRSLWDTARPSISSFRLAGDYALWVAFAKHSPLWSFNQRVSVFRRRPGQLSSSMNIYRTEQDKIASHNFFLEKRIVLFFSIRRFFDLNPQGAPTRLLFFILFPFHRQKWYIDFDIHGAPIKKKAVSYLI